MEPSAPDGPLVEFAVGPGEDAPDEELEGPRHLPGLGTPERRRIATALLVGALIAAVITRVVSSTGPSGSERANTHPAAASSPGRGGSGSGQPAAVEPSPGTSFVRQFPVTPCSAATPSDPCTSDSAQVGDNQDPAECPANHACLTTDDPSPDVVAALQAYLPELRVSNQTTVTDLDAKLVQFRQVSARYRGDDVLVLVTRPPASQLSAREETDTTGDFSMRFVAQPTFSGYEIQVQFDGPLGSLPAFDLLHRIADDPTLLSLL
jgi:hypothetical protein